MRRTTFCYILAGSALIAAGVSWHAWSDAQQALPIPIAAKEKKPAESPLPIKQVVLFNSGVGYFQREGEVAGNVRLNLTFNIADINDLLKSLVLQDLNGGRISTVHFDSQDPLDKILHSFALDLNTNPSFGQILNQARGEKIEVLRREKKDAAPTKLTGTIIGMESRTQLADKETKEALAEVELLNLATASGMQSLPLTELLAVRFLNQRLEGEFHRALEVLASSHDTQKKSVNLGFDGQGKRQVRVGYVVERPIWKTSYRLRLEPNGKVFMQGWALVENTSDDDWNEVRMVLVSGRPISYKMNLYEPLYVPRPTVEPELFASLRPPLYGGAMMQFDGAGKLVAGGPRPEPFNQFLGGGLNNFMGGVGVIGGQALGNIGQPPPQGAPMMGGMMGMMGGGGFGLQGGYGNMGAAGLGGLDGAPFNRYQLPSNPFFLGGQQRLTYEQLQERRQLQQAAREQAKKTGKAVADLNFKEGIASLASSDEVGDYFQYALDQKITLPRQKSAMLPIFDQTIEGTKVSIFNQAVHAKHPLLGLRLKNTSGKPLTQGPITVYDDGTYAGDTRVLDLQPNESRLISYALDQGTEIQAKTGHTRSPDIIAKISGNSLDNPYQFRETKTYFIKNRSKHDRLVVIEHPVRDGWSLVATTPVERARDLYRFQVKAPAGKLATFQVVEEQPRLEHVALTTSGHFRLGEGLSIQPVTKVDYGERFDLMVAHGRLRARNLVRETRTYFFQNTTKTDRTFLVDHLVRPQWKLAGQAGEEGKGPRMEHFRVVVPAGKTVSHAVIEEQMRVEQLAFMKDPGRYPLGLGIEVQPVVKAAPPRLTELKIVKGVLKARYKLRENLTYFAKNNADRGRLFAFEHLIRPDWKRVEGGEDQQSGPVFYRFELKVPAGKTASHEIVEERAYAEPDQPLKSASEEAIQAFLASPAPSAEVKSCLAKAVSMNAKLTEARGQLAEAEKQLKAVSDDQARLRANLGIIPQTAEPFKQFLQKFVTQEREIETLQRQVRELQASVQKQQKAYEGYLAGVSAE
jgi:hypothetical protein